MKRPKKSPITTRTWIIIGALGGGTFVALALVLLVGGFVIWRLVAPNRSGPFKSHMKEYLEGQGGPAAMAESEHPPVAKWVVVNMEKGELDDVHFKLPPELRAAGPEEVRTVVRVSRFTKTGATMAVSRSGNFERWRSTGTLETENCVVVVIDYATWTLLFRADFGGPKAQPPTDQQVLDYLMSLLQKVDKDTK
jgi:hypothetical protein